MTRRTFSILFFVLVLGVLGMPRFAFAETADDIQSQIDANNAKRQSLEAEIATFQKELDALGNKKNTLQSTINSLALSQKQLATRIKVTENKIASTNLQIRELTNSIGDKEEAIATDQLAVAGTLRGIVENERESLVVRLVSSGSLGDAWQAIDREMQFNAALARDIDNLRAVRTKLATDRNEVTRIKENLVSLQKDLTLQKKSVDLNKTAQRKLLADTKNQESVYQKLVAEKQAEEAAFEAELFALASKLKFILDPSRVPSQGKGVLRWPLDNVFITQQFGKTSSSQRLYVSGTHDGVDFRASIGVPVRAALSGIVLETNNGSIQNCQYGKWVLIKHGNGLGTLYAHLSDIGVRKGEVVATGQVIGFTGNTGYATGPHLHFGAYLAEAISFKQYTCKSGRVVTIPIAPISAYLNPLSYL